MTELHLADSGSGSRAEIVAYVREVLKQRTTPNDDTYIDTLVEAIVTSVLHRLGAGYSAAAGHPRIHMAVLAALDERMREVEPESRYEMKVGDRGE